MILIKKTNAEFAKMNDSFLNACKKVTGIKDYQDFKPSTRQASKYRMKKGIAWKVANSLV